MKVASNQSPACVRLMDTIGLQIDNVFARVGQLRDDFALRHDAAWEMQNMLLAIRSNCDLMLQRCQVLMQGGGK